MGPHQWFCEALDMQFGMKTIDLDAAQLRSLVGDDALSIDSNLCDVQIDRLHAAHPHCTSSPHYCVCGLLEVRDGTRTR